MRRPEPRSPHEELEQRLEAAGLALRDVPRLAERTVEGEALRRIVGFSGVLGLRWLLYLEERRASSLTDAEMLARHPHYEPTAEPWAFELFEGLSHKKPRDGKSSTEGDR